MLMIPATPILAASGPLLALSAPSMELLSIIVFGSILPITFFLWIKWWLGAKSSEVENPDEAIAEQAKMDKAHHGHPAAHGHEHGHGHGSKDAHHAHA